MNILEATKCQCGAFTLEVELEDGTTQSYSMSSETLDKELGRASIASVLREEQYCNCNHCVNNWGVDLCACGSGETPEECDNDLEMCGTPMQQMGEIQRLSFWG